MNVNSSDRHFSCAGMAILLASLLAGCSLHQRADLSALSTHLAAPAYARDPSFPQPSRIEFNTVSWVERDPQTKLIYVLQRAAPAVSVWTTSGALVSAWNTQALGDPHSISISPKADAGAPATAWITDMAPPRLAGTGYGHCLKQFTLAGNLLSTIGRCAENSQGTGLNPLQFDKVTDIAWSAPGDFFVSDGDLNGLNNRVLKLDPGGRLSANWSAPDDRPGSGPMQFNLPHALIVDGCDRVWVADTLNHRVQVIGTDGTYYGALKSFGSLGVYALAFGPSRPSPPETILFVGASPTSGGGIGTVFLFRVPVDCSHRAMIGSATPFASFDVPIPSSTSMTLLHSITVDPETWDVYLATLGGALPPQKWTATWPKE